MSNQVMLAKLDAIIRLSNKRHEVIMLTLDTLMSQLEAANLGITALLAQKGIANEVAGSRDAVGGDGPGDGGDGAVGADAGKVKKEGAPTTKPKK